MKRVSLRTIVVLAALLPAVSSAYADLITFSLSQRITGRLVSDNGATTEFSNKLVTFEATMTTQALAACIAEMFGCVDGYSDPWTQIVADSSTLASATWTIEGLGTYTEFIPYVRFDIQGPPEHPTAIAVRSGGDVEGGLGLPDPFVPHPEWPEPCLDVMPCPVEAYTSGGTIQALGIDGPASTSAQITPESAVPEPSTFTLLASGFSATGMMLLRRRGKRV